MPVKIRHRRGTAAQWTAENPVLALAELGLETDTRKFKFGDAKTPWRTLPYASSDGASGPTDTDDLPEGSANLYFTDARARTSISVTAPLIYDDSSGAMSIPKASASVDGYLSAADFATFSSFSGGVPSTRLINTTAPLAGGGDLSADRTLSIPKATASVDGYLASADFSIFAAKESTLTFSTPLSRLANTVSIADAVADGATKGAATFIAADFNSAAGVISIDYTNGQAASAVNKGFLTSADWSTFNAKVSTTRAVNTTAPLTGGGALSGDLTIAMPAATDSVNGYLTAADHAKISAGLALNIAGQRGGMYLS